MNEIDQILEKFGISGADVAEPVSGYRNSTYRVRKSGLDANLIIYKQSDGVLDQIRAANAVGAHLAAAGLPARHPIDERVLRVRVGPPATYACLYSFLPGQTIPWEAYTRARLVSLGVFMSRMHKALQSYSGTTLKPAHVVASETVERMTNYYEKPGVRDAMSRKLGLSVPALSHTKFAQLLLQLGSSKQQQALHMDYVRGNVLFEGDQVCGVIDFEKAAHGHPVFDIARTLAFLLVDCKYKTQAEVRKSFLLSGYAKRGPTPLPRITHSGVDHTSRVLDQLTSLYLLHDFYKFLLHNPYEYLPSNQHFLRTRDQLLARGLIE